MVKFRGIEICVVSQFDIRRLPEFAHRTSPVGEFNATSATCYIPVYPGSQIWFEYTIDGPHPPKAAYFFKLFINNHFITSWDCTAKCGYHGKTSYCLQASDRFGYDVERRGFRFTNVEENEEEKSIPLQDDCIEIRVYRVEYRQRTRSDMGIPPETFSSNESGKLSLVNCGPIEPGRPHRRYKYQLLDPLDTPHARFRFFYRDYEWLEAHGLINTNPVVEDSADSSVLWYDPSQGEVFESSPSGHGSPDYSHPWVMTPTPEHSPRRAGASTLSPSATHKTSTSPLRHATLPGASTISRRIDPHKKSIAEVHTALVNLGLNTSNESLNLSLLTKGSIEDLHSTVPRSPQTTRLERSGIHERGLPDLPSPHQSPSKELEDRNKYNCFDSDMGASRRRPLSPFTRGGFLRRIRSPTPPPVPESVEEIISKQQDIEERDRRASTPTDRIIKYFCRSKKSPISTSKKE